MKIPDFKNKEDFKIIFQEIINVANKNNSILKNLIKLNPDIYLVISDMLINCHIYFSEKENMDERNIDLEWSNTVDKKAPTIIGFNSNFFNGFFQGKLKPSLEIMKGAVVVKGDYVLGIKTINIFANMKNEYNEILKKLKLEYLIVKP